MSKVNNYVALLLLSVILFSCKGEKTVETVPESTEEIMLDENGNPLIKVVNKKIKNPDKLTVIKNMQFDLGADKILELRNAAETELFHKWKENDKKSYIIMDKDLYQYARIHDGESMSSDGDYDGYWIDFNEDLTYVYGYMSEEQGSGRYNYDSIGDNLLLIDNDKSMKPQKYDVKMAGETLIIVGEADYKDNNYQAKLTRISERPQ